MVISIDNQSQPPQNVRVGHAHPHHSGAAVGFHCDEYSAIPARVVNADIPKKRQRADPWLTQTVSWSHEVLEAFGYVGARVVGSLDPKKEQGGTFQTHAEGDPTTDRAKRRRRKGRLGRLHRYALRKPHVVKR